MVKRNTLDAKAVCPCGISLMPIYIPTLPSY